MATTDPSFEPPQPVPATDRVKHDIAPALYAISSLFGRTETPGDAMEAILRVIAGHLECDAAILALVDPDTGSLRIEHLINHNPQLLKADIPSGIGLLGWVGLHRTAILVPDVQHDPRDVPLRPQTRSAIIVPLEIDDHLHGVFSLEKDRAEGFTSAAFDAAIQLVAEAASVLQQLWLIDSLRRKAGQFEVLSGIAQELSSKLDAGEVLQTVTRDSVRLADCVAATIQLFDPESRTLTLHAAHPPGIADPADTCRRPIPLAECLSGSVVTTRKQLEFANLQQPDYEDLQDIPTSSAVETVLATPLLDNGEVTGVLNIFTDHPHRFSNDERRLLRALANIAAVALQNARLYQRVFQSEETLRRSERLTTLGLLAAEIAHETRNPLTVIRLLFGALDLKFPEGDPRNTDVGIIREKLDQLEGFVGRVLSFAKAPESMHSRLLLDDIIRETCLLLRLKLKQAHIHLHYQPPKHPVVVECNKGQIQQVLLNLLLNAVHAMPEGGSISINTETRRDGADTIACIEIQDTGPGIPEPFRKQIFESFLSGRTGASGTGLGLSISKRIMRSHHGDIEIAATGPGGTTMRISIPAAR